MTAKHLPAGDWRLQVYGSTQITGATNRRGPRAADRRRVSDAQGKRCLYCELPIGAEIWRERPKRDKHASGSVELRAHWDHFVPYSYSQTNAASNWALACHVCNGIKTARMFDTVENARTLILPSRIAKGYEAPESVLHRLRMADSTNFEFGVRAPTVTQIVVLRLAAQGLRYVDIARELKVSDAAVSSTMSAAFRRLRAGSRQEAIDLACKYGFLESPEP